jgi:hypothetical protein
MCKYAIAVIITATLAASIAGFATPAAGQAASERQCRAAQDRCLKRCRGHADRKFCINLCKRRYALCVASIPKPTIGPRGPFKADSADILGHSPVFGGQGPAGMGSPVSAPAAPPPAPPPIVIR